MSSDELIQKVERQNGRILTIALLSAIFIICILSVLVVQSLDVQHKLGEQLNAYHNQILDSQAQNKKILNQINKKSDEQERQLKCIAELFTTNRKVSDADLVNCQIQAASALTNSVVSPPTVNSPVKPLQSASSNSTNSPTQQTPSQPNTIQGVINTIQKALGL